MKTDRYNTEIRRSSAASIDVGIFSVFSLIMDNIISHTDAVLPRFILLMIVTFAPFVYSIGLHYKYGQTLGKVGLSILVIDENEERPLSLKQAVLRDSPYLLFAVGAVIYMLLTSIPDNFINYFKKIALIPLVGFYIADLASIAFSSNNRSIRDYLAGSVVINI